MTATKGEKVAISFTFNADKLSESTDLLDRRHSEGTTALGYDAFGVRKKIPQTLIPDLNFLFS